MLTGGTDLMYRQALAAGQEPYIRIEIWEGFTSKVISNLVVSEGSINATLQSRVARTCSFTCHEDFYDTIQPYSQRINAYRGIQFADGSNYSWQVFTGRVTAVDLTEDGRCSVQGSDNAYDVISDQFTSPRNSDVGLYVNDEVRTIIDNRFPQSTFGTSDIFTITVPQLTWDSDPGQALDEMATSVGAFWYPLANGDFVLRKYPWTVPGKPVVTLSDGDSGTVITSHAHKDRLSIFNQIVVTSERVDGSPPVFAVAQDLNPASSTYALGPFGIQSKNISLQTPTTQDGAQDAANAYLKRTTAFTEAWTFTCVPDASLELGDIIGLSVRDRQGIIQVVASFTLPMTVAGTMSVQCRAQVINSLEGV
jgi:hypothetical protein